MLRYSLPSQTRALHKVVAGLALVAALTALLAGLAMAGTIDIPSLDDDAEADQPAVIVPSMHQSDPPLPAEQPVVRSNRDLPVIQYDAPLAGEGRRERMDAGADDISVEHAPWWPDHLEP